MATYDLGTEEVAQLFRCARRRILVGQTPYPVASLALAVLLARSSPVAGGVMLGMGLAWGWSLVASLRYLRARYQAYLRRPGGSVSFEIMPEAVRWRNQAGEGMYRWHAISVEAFGDAFVIRDNDRDLALIPKGVLTEGDASLIQACAKGRRTRR